MRIARLAPPCLGALLCALLATRGAAPAFAQGRPLVDHYTLNLGVSQSTAFINVTRNRDGEVAHLVSDSDYSPYVGLSTPPFFLGSTGFAVGITASYSQFTASQQEFPQQGPAALDTQARGEMFFITPALSYYLGRESPTQFLRVLAGVGWGWARVQGRVQFGDTPGAEASEEMRSPSGASPAVATAIEYRYRIFSIAVYGGGPKLETPDHTYQLGDNSVVLSLAIPF